MKKEIKKIMMLGLAAFVCFGAWAESTLEIVPFTVAKGTTKKSVKLDMLNPADEFTAFQCDVYLPEGISWATTIDKRGNVKIAQPIFDVEADRTDADYHTVDAGKNADGSINILVYSMAKETFLEEEGAIIDIPLVFDAEMVGGVYDIQLKNMVLTRTDQTQEKPDDYTFSVLVGVPETSSLKLRGDFTYGAIAEFNAVLNTLPQVTSIDLTEAVAFPEKKVITMANPNAVIYIPDGKTIANTQNVVVGTVCAKLVLADGNAFGPAKAFTATEGTYTRTMTVEEIGTTVLPFVPDAATKDAYEFYGFTSADANTLTFDAVADPQAGVPYLVICKTADTALNAVSGADVVITAGQQAAGTWTMKGLYVQNVFTDAAKLAGLRYISGGKFMQATTTLTMNPFRAYFEGEGSATAIELRGGGTTRIVNLESAENAESLYDLQGRKTLTTENGIYIVNGQKQYVH